MFILKKIFFSFLITLGFIVTLGSTTTVEASSIDIGDLEDPTVEISDVMTSEEIIEEYMINQDVSYEQAEEALFSQSSFSTYSDISLYAINYRTLKKTLTSNAGFVYFYCQTDESSGSFHGIKKIMNAGYASGAKIYSGSFFYHLPDANKINFILNGHLYNTGTTTVSGGGSAGIGKTVNAHVNISKTTDYYKALYVNTSLAW